MVENQISNDDIRIEYLPRLEEVSRHPSDRVWKVRWPWSEIQACHRCLWKCTGEPGAKNSLAGSELDDAKFVRPLMSGELPLDPPGSP